MVAVTMRIKRNKFYSIIIILLWIVLGFAYLYLLVLPYLRGVNDLYVYNGDSVTYRNVAQGDIANDFLTGIKSGYAAGKFNLIGMASWSSIAESISYNYYYHVTLVLNLIVMMIAVRNYRLIFEYYNSREYPKFILLMALNLFIVSSLCNISKEIWGLLIISLFLKYALYKNWVKYMIVVACSFLIRDVYAFIGILFFVINNVKMKKICYLIGISLLVPFIVPEGQVRMLMQGQDEKSLGISILLNDIQLLPLGYIITYIPKLLLSAFADLSPLRFIKSSNNIIGHFTTISAALSLILFLLICIKTFVKGIKCNKTLLNFTYAYTLIAAMTAFIHHRYLFPLYPALIMLLLIHGPKTTVSPRIAKTAPDSHGHNLDENL